MENEAKEILKSLIEKEILPASDSCSNEILKTYLEVGQTIYPYSKATESRMHSNSAISYPELGEERPASAFFTLLEDKVIIEWGKINEKGNISLHDDLRKHIDYYERAKHGATIRSGHLFTIKLAGRESYRLALFDCFGGITELQEGKPEYKIIMTLLNNRIFPITSDGLALALTPELKTLLSNRSKKI